MTPGQGVLVQSAFLRTLALSLVAAFALGQPLHAQGPEKGDFSVGILLFTAETGTVMNIGRQWTDRLHIGVELDYRGASIHQEVTNVALGVETRVSRHDFALGPVVRWYGTPVGPVVPFLRVRAIAGWGDEKFEQAGAEQLREETNTLAASVGIGAEWFPMRQISLSGYTGLQVSRVKTDRIFPTGEFATQKTINSGTFRSALSISFYFR
jgi:hypothetical protein